MDCIGARTRFAGEYLRVREKFIRISELNVETTVITRSGRVRVNEDQ